MNVSSKYAAATRAWRTSSPTSPPPAPQRSWQPGNDTGQPSSTSAPTGAATASAPTHRSSAGTGSRLARCTGARKARTTGRSWPGSGLTSWSKTTAKASAELHRPAPPSWALRPGNQSAVSCCPNSPGLTGLPDDPAEFLKADGTTQGGGGANPASGCRVEGWRGGVAWRLGPAATFPRVSPAGCFTAGPWSGRSVSSPRRFEPCVRFSRTRLTDAVHRRHSACPARACRPWVRRRFHTS